MVNRLITSLKCDLKIGYSGLKVRLTYSICALYVLYMNSISKIDFD